jgi:hypothetical protein
MRLLWWWLVAAMTIASSFVLFDLAQAGEIITCSAEPGVNDGKEWHYRTKVPDYASGIRDDKCWYIGERMKPRNELRWLSRSASEAARPGGRAAVTPTVSGAAPATPFEHRWHGNGAKPGWDHKE